MPTTGVILSLKPNCETQRIDSCFRSSMLSFLVLTFRNPIAEIFYGGAHPFGILGVWIKEQVFFQLLDRTRIVFLFPVEPAKIIVGHAQLSGLRICRNQQFLFRLFKFVETKQGYA